MILDEIYSILKKRNKSIVKGSYSSLILRKGEDMILQKIGEEAVEVIIAGKNKDKQRLIEEIADLYYMILLVLVKKNILLAEIYKELKRRKK